jgi:hypothetical protein
MSAVVDFGKDVVDAITGETGAEAAVEAAEIQAAAGTEALAEQRAAAERAQAFFDPLQGVAQRGIEGAGFLADPQAQFEFLQSNPLFKLALENADRQTLQGAAAGGRVSAGDTLEQLSKNVLLSAQPLIGQQREDITNLLNLSQGLATSRANIETGQGANVANLLTDIGAARAGGEIGAAQARQQGVSNILSLISPGAKGAQAVATGGIA